MMRSTVACFAFTARSPCVLYRLKRSSTARWACLISAMASGFRAEQREARADDWRADRRSERLVAVAPRVGGAVAGAVGQRPPVRVPEVDRLREAARTRRRGAPDQHHHHA